MVSEKQLQNFKKKFNSGLDDNAKKLKDAVDAKKSDKYPYKNMVSPSMFERFTECPKQWELRYKDKRYEPEDNENTIFGDAVHRVAEDFLEKKYNENVGVGEYDFDTNIKKFIKESAMDVKSRFIDDASENREFPYNEEILKKMYQDAKKAFWEFKDFMPRFFRDGLKLVSVEQEFSGPMLHNLDFRGKVDLVVYDENTKKFCIVDIKSSNSSWTEENINMRAKKIQLLSYKYYFSKSLDISMGNIKTVFLILNRKGNGKNGDFDHIELYKISSEEEDISWMKNEWSKFIKNTIHPSGYFLEKNYPKKPSSKFCQRCPYSTEFNGNGVCDQGGVRWNPRLRDND